MYKIVILRRKVVVLETAPMFYTKQHAGKSATYLKRHWQGCSVRLVAVTVGKR